MNFKENVEFYLKQNNKFNYYGFDVENGNIAEDDDTAEGAGTGAEASTKTEKKSKKCPKCGKEPCECDASMKTNTHGEEDDDGWHASAGTPPADFGATPEEIEMIKLIKKNGGLGGKFVAETPEEKEMLKLAAKDTQLIIATHSPHLLNQFELEDVLIFEKNENNSTEVKKLSEEDFSEYEGDLLPGQLWLNGELGGKRW